MILRYTIAWVPMVFMAIANGALRQLGYGKYMGELAGHQVSCFTGIGIFFIYTYLLAGRWPLRTSRQAWTVGVLWLVLTVAFEFLFGRYAARKSWGELLHDYNVLEGRLWSLVLLSLAVMPYAAYRIGLRQRLQSARYD